MIVPTTQPTVIATTKVTLRVTSELPQRYLHQKICDRKIICDVFQPINVIYFKNFNQSRCR